MYAEAKIEAHLVKRVAELGGIARKVAYPNRRGAPDRFCFLPNGVLLLIELKALGKKPSASQAEEHKRLINLGFKLLVLDSIEAINRELKQYE
jgi:hypothetical protein